MTYSVNTVAADGTTNVFAVPFPYLSKSDVHVYINGGEVFGFTWPTSGTIQLTASAISLAGDTITVKRITQVSTPSVVFSAGGLDPSTLNTQTLQLLYLDQENYDEAAVLNSRSVALAASDPTVGPLYLPPKSQRANSYLGCDSYGNFVTLPSPTGVFSPNASYSAVSDPVGDPFAAMSHSATQTLSTPAVGAAVYGGMINTGVNPVAMPCAVVAYGNNKYGGGALFGFFGRVDANAPGVVSNEFDSFNWYGPLLGAYPPNKGFGAPNALPIALCLAAGGTYPSFCALEIAGEGGTPNQFLTGVYVNPGSVSSFGIFVDANGANSPVVSANLKNNLAASTSRNLFMQSQSGSPSSSAKFIEAVDAFANVKFGVRSTGHLELALSIVAASATAGASGPLPSNPANYMPFYINGVLYKFPYYNA